MTKMGKIHCMVLLGHKILFLIEEEFVNNIISLYRKD